MFETNSRTGDRDRVDPSVGTLLLARDRTVHLIRKPLDVGAHSVVRGRAEPDVGSDKSAVCQDAASYCNGATPQRAA